MTERFKNSDDIVGQFLPKVYTRRITLEDTQISKLEFRNTRRRRVLRKVKAPGTAITVDFQIKDVLSEEGLGVITNNQNPEEDANQVQDEVLSSLKIAVMLFSDNSVFETVFNTIRNFSAFGWRVNLPSTMPSFEQYLKQAVQNLNREENRVLLEIKDARPETIGFEVRNSQYQEYDLNNNLINVIPYAHTFKVETEEFGMCKDLSLVCFTYFDFESLSLDEITPDEIRRLGYVTGDLVADTITRDGLVESTALVYKDAITNQPYYGPVHTMGDGSIMTGLMHKDNSRSLISRQVPLTKIQDFRSFQRLQETNYQPPSLQTFDSSIPSLDLIEKSNKDFFDVEDVVVDFDRMEKVANIEFTIDLPSIYEHTRYYDLVKSNQANIMFGYPALLDILEITVVRRRVTKRLLGNNRLGSLTRIPFDQVEEEDFIVATSGQNASISLGGNRKVVTKEDGDSKIMEVQVPGFAGIIKRRFFVEDREVADYLGTGAVFQYGVKLRVKDPTKDRFINLLQVARRNLQQLNLYLQEASIPVFDSRMIIKPDPNQPISLDDVRDPPQYGESVQQGNYDAVTNTFTKDFVTKSKRKYGLQGFVDNYIDIIEIAFAKSEVSLYNYSNPVQGNDGERGMVNEGNAAGIRATPLDLLMSQESMTMTSAAESLYNMINPSNARPETIRSFIKTYQDLVMDLEDYFDIGYTYSLSTEGSGYKARGDNTLTMQRWFSGVDENEDGSPTESDNYIDMSPLQRVFFRYWRDGDLQKGLGIPRISDQVYRDRLALERSRFPGAAIEAATARMTPLSIIIGDDEVFFDEKEMKREESARRARQKAEDLERQGKIKAYHEQKRKGNKRKKKPFKRRYKLKRFILATPSDGKLISNFVQELNLMNIRNGPQATNSVLGAVNAEPVTPASSQSRGSSFPGYFSFLSSITEEMLDGAFQYSNSIEDLLRAETSLSDLNIEEFVSSNIATCGIVDNRPTGNEISNEDNRFIREEGLYPGLFNDIQPLPPIRIPQLPQVTLPNFPAGAIFAESGRVFTSSFPSLPTQIPQIQKFPKFPSSFPGPMSKVLTSFPVSPAIGAVKSAVGAGLGGMGSGLGGTGPLGGSRNTTTRTSTRTNRTKKSVQSSGRKNLTRGSRSTGRTSTSRTSTSRVGTTRASASTSMGNFRAAPRTSSASRSSSRSRGRTPNMGRSGSSGPRLGGYGY